MTSRGATPDGLVWLGECYRQLAELQDYESGMALDRIASGSSFIDPAVERLSAAIESKELRLVTADRMSVDGDVWRLGCWDKHRATLLGKFVAQHLHEVEREQAGEAPLDGRWLYVEALPWRVWFESNAPRRTVAAETRCRGWLEREMRKSPDNRPRPRTEWQLDAISKFGVMGRPFDRAWAEAIKRTGANWSAPGRPTKNPRT